MRAGQYAEGKDAFIGVMSWLDNHYGIFQLQLDPPGISVRVPGNEGPIFNDTKRIWYLYKHPKHYYKWVDSKNGEIPPFAVTVADDIIGVPTLLPGRIIHKGNLVTVGTVGPTLNRFIYQNMSTEKVKMITSGYQVLTCRSSINSKL